MNRRRLPLNALRAFEAAARAGGFRAGAIALGISQSAISEHVANLEALADQALFERSGRSVRLTKAGMILLPAITRSLDDLEQALDSINANRRVRVHLAPTFLEGRVMELIGEFRRTHPTPSIDLRSGNRTGAPEEAVDIEIVFDRSNAERDTDTLLRAILFSPLCSPKCGPVRGEPLAKFLSRSELLHVRISGEPDDFLWERMAAEIGVSLAGRPNITFPTAVAAATYAANGSGVMLGEVSNEWTRLIAPFPELEVDLGFGFYLRSRGGAINRPPVARLYRWLSSHLRQAPPSSTEQG